MCTYRTNLDIVTHVSSYHCYHFDMHFVVGHSKLLEKMESSVSLSKVATPLSWKLSMLTVQQTGQAYIRETISSNLMALMSGKL